MTGLGNLVWMSKVFIERTHTRSGRCWDLSAPQGILVKGARTVKDVDVKTQWFQEFKMREMLEMVL